MTKQIIWDGDLSLYGAHPTVTVIGRGRATEIEAGFAVSGDRHLRDAPCFGLCVDGGSALPHRVFVAKAMLQCSLYRGVFSAGALDVTPGIVGDTLALLRAQGHVVPGCQLSGAFAAAVSSTRPIFGDSWLDVGDGLALAHIAFSRGQPTRSVVARIDGLIETWARCREIARKAVPRNTAETVFCFSQIAHQVSGALDEIDALLATVGPD